METGCSTVIAEVVCCVIKNKYCKWMVQYMIVYYATSQCSLVQHSSLQCTERSVARIMPLSRSAWEQVQGQITCPSSPSFNKNHPCDRLHPSLGGRESSPETFLYIFFIFFYLFFLFFMKAHPRLLTRLPVGPRKRERLLFPPSTPGDRGRGRGGARG